MCFGSPDPPPPTPATPPPAPAAPPPSPTASTAVEDVASARRAEDLALFGSGRQSLRVDRSATSGGIGKGGSGIKV
jgi:hypothetical protein